MPSRENQRKNWEQALRNIKPYYQEEGKTKQHKDTFIGCTNPLSKEPAWKGIPNEPYLLWTRPTQRVEEETTNKTVKEEIKYIQEQHKKHPLLYSNRELSPVEYILLQTYVTNLKRKEQEETGRREDIVPLDDEGYTRFPACRLFAHNVLGAYFALVPRVWFDVFEVSASVGGVRLVGRL